MFISHSSDNCRLIYRTVAARKQDVPKNYLLIFIDFKVIVMSTKKLLEPFFREQHEGDEPSDHQRRFLYLPLSILRDFTNIELIIKDDFIKKKARLPTKTEMEKTIVKYHQQMGQLNKWKNWKLNKLEFRLTQPNQTG